MEDGARLQRAHDSVCPSIAGRGLRILRKDSQRKATASMVVSKALVEIETAGPVNESGRARASVPIFVYFLK